MRHHLPNTTPLSEATATHTSNSPPINTNDTPTKATVLTSEVINEKVVDFLLANINTLYSKDADIDANQFIETANKLNEFCNELVSLAIVNRVNLSAMKTLRTKATIEANPDTCPLQGQPVTYQMGYSVIEDNGQTSKQKIYSLPEAMEVFGERNVEQYWGKLSEQGAKKVVNGNTTYWFSCVRFPVSQMFETSLATDTAKEASTPHTAPSVG